MSKMTINETPEFVLDWGLTEQSESHTLQTAGKFVDKDIQIDVKAKDGALTATPGTITTVNEVTVGNDYFTTEETGHAVVVTATATEGAETVAVTTEGWVNAEDNVTIDAKESVKTLALNIKKGSLTGDGEASAEGGNGVTLGDALTSAPTEGFYVKADAAGSVSVGTAGWVDENTEAVSTNGTAYYPIKELRLTNAAIDADADYDVITAPVLTQDGYLYLTEGYRKDTKISLATLVPDDASLSNDAESAKKIYHDETAYDNDGKLIVGTMQDVVADDISVSGNDAEAEIGTVTVTPSENKFVVTGEGIISGTATSVINAEGFIAGETQKTGAIEGTATVDATLDVVTVGATVVGDGTVKPELSKVSGTVLNDGITTSADAKGEFYVAVKADAKAETITITPKVTGEGYGTADLHNATPTTATAGSVDSDTYYVPITAGSVSYEENASEVVAPVITLTPSVTTSTMGINTAGVLAAAPSTGDYIVIGAATTTTKGSVKTSVTTTVTEGYQKASTKANAVTEEVTVAEKETHKYIAVYDGSFI